MLRMVQPSKNVSNGLSDSHQLQTWFSVLADPQFTTVYAVNQTGRRACHDSAETLTANWETLQSHVTSWNKLTGVNIATHGLCIFPGVSADCASPTESVCEKYKSLTRVISRASPTLRVCLRTDPWARL